MDKRMTTLSRIFIVIAGIVSSIILFLVLPAQIYLGARFYTMYGFCFDMEILGRSVIWYFIIFICAIPCYLALVQGWKIVDHIQNKTVFSDECVRSIGILYKYALFDTVFLTIMNVVMMIVENTHPALILTSIVVVGIGVIFTLIFKVVYESLKEAVRLKQESELTI